MRRHPLEVEDAHARLWGLISRLRRPLPFPRGVPGTFGSLRSAPYTPEQDGIIERFFCSLKEEHVSRYSFVSFAHARRKLGAGVRWHNDRRPHQALDYRGPREFSPDEITRVA